MMQIMANSGILSDDYLDGLRAKALQGYPSGLQKDMVEYIKALELTIINRNHEGKRKSLEAVWSDWIEK